MLDAMEEQLKGFCQIVARAEDGRALIDRVREHQPDIVVTDISMPRMNGIQALRELRSQGLKTSAIIVTVHEDEDLVRAALEQGVLGFVLKSQLGSDLSTAVHEVLEGRVFVSERLRKKIS
jgi:DNA-binding NarL/FixJ family response regulator